MNQNEQPEDDDNEDESSKDLKYEGIVALYDKTQYMQQVMVRCKTGRLITSFGIKSVFNVFTKQGKHTSSSTKSSSR